MVVEPGMLSRNLRTRSDLVHHSPSGFGWGYCGSGPAQLALALCADALGNDAAARAVYQRFKVRVVARLPQAIWRLTADEVRRHCRELSHEDTAAYSNACLARLRNALRDRNPDAAKTAARDLADWLAADGVLPDPLPDDARSHELRV